MIYNFDMLEQKIRSELPYHVTKKRLSHILSVEKTAVFLCDFFSSLGITLERDEIVIAALLHDITKCMDQMELCEHYGIRLTADDSASIQTVHAITGAYFSRDQYGINESIFSAILCHTVGKSNMSLTDKIVFASDYCEETRTHEECIRLRKKLLGIPSAVNGLFTDLARIEAIRLFDLVVAEIYGKTISYLLSKGQVVHHTSLEGFRFLLDSYENDSDFLELRKYYPKS